MTGEAEQDLEAELKRSAELCQQVFTMMQCRI